MLKNVLKVLYIGVVVILALFVYIMGYNTNTADHIKKITNEAIQERDYTEVARIHGGCFDEVNIVEAQPSINTNNYELAVFKSASLFTTSYLNNEEQMLEYNVFDYSYYIYYTENKLCFSAQYLFYYTTHLKIAMDKIQQK